MTFLNISKKLCREISPFSEEREYQCKNSKTDSSFQSLRQLLLDFWCIDTLKSKLMIRWVRKLVKMNLPSFLRFFRSRTNLICFAALLSLCNKSRSLLLTDDTRALKKKREYLAPDRNTCGWNTATMLISISVLQKKKKIKHLYFSLIIPMTL